MASTGNVEFSTLPGIITGLTDGGTTLAAAARGPRTLVLGVAGKGQANNLYVVRDPALASSEYGIEGTLTRGMYETKTAGAANVILYRVGATPAKLEHVGDSTGSGGYTIETVARDDSAGSAYSVYYDDDLDRLIIWNVSDGVIVYDNDSSDPIQLGEVYVSGAKAVGGGPDIGGPSSGVNLEDVTATGTTFTAGTDGKNPSRMELYEYYDKAYKDLLGQEFDYVVPMDIRLDDKNVAEGDSFGVTYISSITNGSTYPTPDSTDDILGKVFIETYRGKRYYFWDLDGDGEAELWPYGIGSASGTTKIDGTTLTAADFHEVNFGYQLGVFCHKISVNYRFALGFLGTLPPTSTSPEVISDWIGDAPVFTTRSTGVQYIASVSDNGTGLLGNKFMSGSYSHRSGTAYGGFMLTASGWLDGVEVSDENDEPIDLGKYLSVVCSAHRLFNAFERTGRGYVANLAPTYAGFVSTLDEQSAPTNKVPGGMQLAINVGPEQADILAKFGYIVFFDRPQGITIADAPTAARPQSDYNRLTTMRIVKRVIGAIRSVANPFIGESFNPGQKNALDNAINRRIQREISGGYLIRGRSLTSQSLAQRKLGHLDLRLELVPAYELRRIIITTTLKPI